MTRRCPLPLGLSLLGLLAVAAPAQQPQAEPDPIMTAMLEAHNEERAKENLPPLTLSPLLEIAAKAHARDMADHDKMAHEGSDGSTPSVRIVRAGYHYRNAGENVARGFEDVPRTMQLWIDSPPHKKNILGEFKEVGFARAYSKEGQPFWAADFGRPMPKLDKANAGNDFLKLLNDERKKADAAPLAIDPALTKNAQDQADKLASKTPDQQIALSFDGVDQRRYRELGMASAVGQALPDEVLKTLTASTDHRTQLMGKFTRIGIGYATAADGVPTWIILLGLPAGR